MSNIIIGTAGHVDHGKTEIVKALTGRDTDRLEEERERGISIVLGFAPVDLGEGITAGIVDVPGHERFVKNMVSGAVGVDLALMVVAADEGVMPQTIEHFEVLRLLGVDAGVVAVTKVDLVEEEIAEIVQSEMSDLLRGSPLEKARFVHTSAKTGMGIEELRKELRELAASRRTRAGGSFFRMPVDRVFSRTGIGTIVTGTTWSGTVRKGDELVMEPGARKVRVREVHNFDTALEEAGPGLRTALALHGVKAGDIHTGSQVMSPGVAAAARMIDVKLEVSSITGSRLKNRQRIRFHHAAAEILGRVVLLDSEELGPGETGLVQLRLEKPAFAIGKDRFVIRAYSPMRVIAGGTVLDPSPAKARRFDADHSGMLQALASDSAIAAVRALLERAGPAGLDRGRLRIYGISDQDAGEASGHLLEKGEAVEIGGLLVSSGEVEMFRERIYSLLDRYGSSNPLSWGMEQEQLRIESGLVKGAVFERLLEEGKSQGKLFFRNGRVRAGSSEIELPGDERSRLEKTQEAIRSAGMEFVSRADLIPSAGDEKRLLNYLQILVDEGKVVRVGEDAYLDAEVLEGMVERLGRLLSEKEEISVGDFKDLFGLTRKYAVPLLEYLDRESLTVRKGDARIAGPALPGKVK